MTASLFISDADAMAFASGVAVSLGMVLSIGPRTLLLIRLGATSRYCWWAATAGLVSDCAIFLVAVLSIGVALQSAPQAAVALKILGVGFLFWFGLKMLRSGGSQTLDCSAATQTSCRLSVLQMLSVTWFNPLVYLETGLVAGTVSQMFDGSAKPFFVAGYLCISVLKFYGWTMVGGQMGRWLATASGLNRFNIASAAVMFVAAATLAWSVLVTGNADALAGEAPLPMRMPGEGLPRGGS